MKKVIIVHGWGGHPKEGWFPWLKKELEAKGIEVLIPKLPDTENPRIQNWVPALSDAVGVPDGETYFVGHSLGCQTIARYIETLPYELKIGGAVFVAGFFKRLTGLESEEQETARLWLETPIDLEKVKSHLPKSIAIFSDDDPFVPLDNVADFKDRLGSEIITIPKAGHINAGSNYFKLPEALKALESMFSS
ncbi:MAG: alpha/beta fold hydrolase [bacterium]|nr:alpha/beta fold hydrolase [bacterium]